MAFLTFPIRNETTSHPIREIFRHICKTRKPPCRERVAFFLLFPSIYSFAEGGLCSHYLYIYQAPSQWQPFLTSSYQFFGGYSHIVSRFVSTSLPPTPKQPVAVVVIYILRTFATKLLIVTLVCAMSADTIDIFNVCETAACHDLHGAPDTPDALVDGITS